MKIPVKLRFSLTLRSALSPEKLPRRLTKVMGKILANGPRVVRKLFKGALRVEASASSGFHRRPESGFLRFGEEGVGYYVDHYHLRSLGTALHRLTTGADIPDDLKQILVNFAEELGRMHNGGHAGPAGTTVVSPFHEAYEGRTSPPEPATRLPSPSVVDVQSIHGRSYDSLTKTFAYDQGADRRRAPQPQRNRWTPQT